MFDTQNLFFHLLLILPQKVQKKKNFIKFFLEEAGRWCTMCPIGCADWRQADGSTPEPPEGRLTLRKKKKRADPPPFFYLIDFLFF